MEMCFHGNQLSWGINHLLISLLSKYRSPAFIRFSSMLAPVISSLDEIYCMLNSQEFSDVCHTTQFCPMYVTQPRGYEPSNYEPRGYEPRCCDLYSYESHGYEPHGYEPQGFKPCGYELCGHKPHGYVLCGYEPCGYQSRSFEPLSYKPCGY